MGEIYLHHIRNHHWCMAKAAAKTGLMPTALVAVEQSFPRSQRVIDDSLAIRMLPFGAVMFVRLLKFRWIRDWLIGLSEKSNPGIWGGLLCRKRYIDEKVEASRNEIEAVVSLGAGFDARPFRLPALSGLPTWEIDQHENIEAKEKRLRKALGAIPASLKLVTVDFDRDDLGATLEAQGYSASKRTFFVCEAVTQYLTEQGVRTTFDWLAGAIPGSRLAFTYVRKSFLTGNVLYGWESGYKRFVATKVWLFGMEPEECAPLLQGYGWRVLEDVGYEELSAIYIQPTGRHMSSTAVERMVYAEKI
jgi:methyltransferase (TIGR00027 family)